HLPRGRRKAGRGVDARDKNPALQQANGQSAPWRFDAEQQPIHSVRKDRRDESPAIEEVRPRLLHSDVGAVNPSPGQVQWRTAVKLEESKQAVGRLAPLRQSHLTARTR